MKQDTVFIRTGALGAKKNFDGVPYLETFMIIPIVLLMLAKFVMVNKGKVIVETVIYTM